MYNALLILHNFLRWVLLISAVLVLYQNYTGWDRGTKFTKGMKTTATVFLSTLDTQLLLGLILYIFYSPAVTQAFGNMKEAMHDRSLRFWSVEHITMMLIGVIIAHVGYVKSRSEERRVGKEC